MYTSCATWKAAFHGTTTAALYALMFYHSDLILHLAHTTPEACVIGEGHGALYLHHADAASTGGGGEGDDGGFGREHQSGGYGQ